MEGHFGHGSVVNPTSGSCIAVLIAPIHPQGSHHTQPRGVADARQRPPPSRTAKPHARATYGRPGIDAQCLDSDDDISGRRVAGRSFGNITISNFWAPLGSPTLQKRPSDVFHHGVRLGAAPEVVGPRHDDNEVGQRGGVGERPPQALGVGSPSWIVRGSGIISSGVASESGKTALPRGNMTSIESPPSVALPGPIVGSEMQRTRCLRTPSINSIE